jgi:hypothetical protein
MQTVDLMKTNVQQTSLEAYWTVIPTLGDKQSKVFEAIKQLQPCTDKEISLYLGWPINTCTPRRGELVTLGLVIQSGIKRNEYNRPAISWGVKPGE